MRPLLAAAVVLATCALAGCATTRLPDIDDAWVARIPPERMAPVEAARAEHRRSQDAVLRARVAREDAQRELAADRAAQKAAQAKVTAAKKALEAALPAGDYRGEMDARSELARAEEELRLANLRVEAGTQRIDYSEAREALDEAREVRASAEVDRAQYRVLQEQGDARVRQIAPADFDRGLSQMAKKETQLERRLEQERAELERRVQRLR